MLDRIQELLAARELSPSQFADTIGVSRPVVSHLLSGRNKPSLEVVQKVLAAFPDVSMNWLLNGDGPMLARPATLAPAATASTPKPAARLEAPKKPEQPPLAARTAIPAPTEPATIAEPVVAPKQPESAASSLAQQVPAVTTPVSRAPAKPAPAGTEIAVALAEPGKIIRRIVLFYQDGTFADFRPEDQ